MWGALSGLRVLVRFAYVVGLSRAAGALSVFVACCYFGARAGALGIAAGALLGAVLALLAWHLAGAFRNSRAGRY